MSDLDLLNEAELNDSAKTILMAMPGYAKMTRKYYTELMREGFGQAHALELTGKFMGEFIKVGENDEK